MPTATQVKAVERLVHESVQAVDALTTPAINAVLPALLRARDELRADLQKWIEDHPDGEERFTAYQKKQALLAMESSLQRIQDLQPAMARALGMGRKTTGEIAAKNLGHEVQRLSAIFDGGMVTIPQIDTAAVVAMGNKLLWKRHENSAKRYAGGIGDDVRTRLSVSLAKGDTFEQAVQRLRGSAQFRAAVAASDPNAAAHGVSDALFNKWRHWADRLVRTENMHAYNTQHDLAIEHVNENRSADDDEYLRRWDATADKTTCPLCESLDRTLATIKGDFKGGVHSPPLHPYCRCVVLAWLARWGDFRGEVPAKGDDGKDLAPEPTRISKRKTPPDELPATSSDVPKEGEVRRVRARDLHDRGYHEPPAGLDEVKLGKARKTIAEGQRDPATVIVGKDGALEVTDGRHRIRAAVEADAEVLVRFERGKHAGKGDVIKVGGPEEPPKERKNPKRVAAAKKAAEASAERRREIHSTVRDALPRDLQLTWDKEGHKFMRDEAKRIRGTKDRVNAAAKLSEAFAEQYGSGEQTIHGNEGDRSHRAAQIVAEHAESWADEQERKYYEQQSKEHAGWLEPKKTNDDDPPF